jgi:hypothetical protein
MQTVKHSPVNLRPFLGIPKRVMAKSLSDLASAAVLRSRLGDDPVACDSARVWLDRLLADRCAGGAGAAWGMPAPYISRFIDAASGQPNLFWTINAATAFLDAFELEGRRTDLDVARSAIEFIRHDLGFVDAGEDGVWLPYFAAHEAIIYNVTALAGALLQRVAHHTGEADLADLGRRALRFVVRQQNADGSWWYAQGADGRWVDGFHTCYVLESLLQSALLEPDATNTSALQRGVAFYVERLFTASGVPRYAVDRTWPLEVQNCAQAIQTLSKLVWLDAARLPFAERVASVVIDALYRETHSGAAPEGYFIISRGRWTTNALPAVRWGQAPMLLALTYLQAARRGVQPTWCQSPVIR